MYNEAQIANLNHQNNLRNNSRHSEAAWHFVTYMIRVYTLYITPLTSFPFVSFFSLSIFVVKTYNPQAWNFPLGNLNKRKNLRLASLTQGSRNFNKTSAKLRLRSSKKSVTSRDRNIFDKYLSRPTWWWSAVKYTRRAIEWKGKHILRDVAAAVMSGL